MNVSLLSALMGANEFTGFEHARIIDLLTVLAYVSIVMWAIVFLSIIVRQGAILIIRILRFSRTHHLPTIKYFGKSNGS
jgi:hypothetical protein